MRMIVKGRHMAVTPALQEYAHEKVGKVTRIIDNMLMDAEVELWVEKNPSIENNQVCEVTIWTKGPVIRAKEAAPDMYAAIDMAADKLTSQLRKFKGKLVDRHSSRGRFHKPDYDIPLDILEEPDRELVKTKRVKVAPMSTEEAMIRMDMLGHDFFVFTHDDDDGIHVLYRREDGDYGLIQPVIEQE